jgi:hypothetical protein
LSVFNGVLCGASVPLLVKVDLLPLVSLLL